MPKDCNECGKEFVPDPDTCPCCITKKIRMSGSQKKLVLDTTPVYHLKKECRHHESTMCHGWCPKLVCTWCSEQIRDCYDEEDDLYYTAYYCKSCYGAIHK